MDGAFDADVFDADAFDVGSEDAPPTPTLAAPAPLERRPGVVSSAVRLADLALEWANGAGAADLVKIDGDLASDAGLGTAVLLSLWTDRRAEPDDVPPSGDPNDRRGWWADEFAEVEGDRFGSRLWLLDRSVRSPEVARRAEEYAREALAWMLEDRVVERIDVDVQTTGQELSIDVTLHRPGRDPVRFAHVWNSLTKG